MAQKLLPQMGKILELASAQDVVVLGCEGSTFVSAIEGICKHRKRTAHVLGTTNVSQKNPLDFLLNLYGYDCMVLGRECTWETAYGALLCAQERAKEMGTFPLVILVGSDSLKAARALLQHSFHPLEIRTLKGANACVMLPHAGSLHASAEAFLEPCQANSESPDPDCEQHMLRIENEILQRERQRESHAFCSALHRLRDEKQALGNQVQSLIQHLTLLRERHEKWSARLLRMESSRSWRFTAPLRRLESAWNKRNRNHTHEQRESAVPPTPVVLPAHQEVAIVIPCRNYAQYLGEALESVLAQTHLPTEILVMDDASIDATAEVAARYAARGVGYMRGEWGDVGIARNAGSALTKAPFLVFLDADDTLPRDYIQRCLEQMADPCVGIAYSDVIRFGERNHHICSPEFSREQLFRRNYIPACALLRRSAFAMAGGYRACHGSHEDWDLYKRMVRLHWAAAKASTHFCYRAHGDSMFHAAQKGADWQYFRRSMLLEDPVTIGGIFREPLQHISSYFDTVLSLGLKPELLHLHCHDATGDALFAQKLKECLAAFPGSRTTYSRGNLLLPQGESLYPRAVGEIASSCNTPLLLLLQPGVRPRPGTLKKLIEHLQEEDVVAVSAPSRDPSGAWQVWKNDPEGNLQALEPALQPAESIDAASFDCLLMRTPWLRLLPVGTTKESGNHVATCAQETCLRLREYGRILCAWDTKIDTPRKALSPAAGNALPHTFS